MRIILIVLALTGCTGDPHEVVTCDLGWVTRDGAPITKCHAACQAAPTMAAGFSMCRTGMVPNGPVTYCPNAQLVEEGCCVSPNGITVALYPCLE